MIHIALLRAVNVGGRGKVAMADVRALLADLGCSDVRSVLPSGNLVFSAGPSATSELETRFEAELARRYGVATDIFVRTRDDWHKIIATNPHPGMARDGPGHLLVMALRDAPVAAAVEAARAAIVGCETIVVVGREAYLTYPHGIGRSRLTGQILERKLGTRRTARNWNTVMKIAALCKEPADRRRSQRSAGET